MAFALGPPLKSGEHQLASWLTPFVDQIAVIHNRRQEGKGLDAPFDSANSHRFPRALEGLLDPVPVPEAGGEKRLCHGGLPLWGDSVIHRRTGNVAICTYRSQ